MCIKPDSNTDSKMSVPFRLVLTIWNIPYAHRTLLSVFFFRANNWYLFSTETFTYAEFRIKQKLNKTVSRMTFVDMTIHKFLYWLDHFVDSLSSLFCSGNRYSTGFQFIDFDLLMEI